MLMPFQLFATDLKPEIWIHTGHLFHLLQQGSFHMADEDCTGALVGKCNRDVQGNWKFISPSPCCYLTKIHRVGCPRPQYKPHDLCMPKAAFKYIHPFTISHEHQNVQYV